MITKDFGTTYCAEAFFIYRKCAKIYKIMDTEILQINRDDPDDEGIQKAGKIIRAGGLVAFPTETVYGLGGDALNPDSSRKIYAAKGRPSDNPLIVHISDVSDIPDIAVTDNIAYVIDGVREKVAALAERFWPGPLTVILHKKDKVPYETTGGLDTVAIRMPSDPIALAFIKASGGYIAAPSANISGRPSPTRVSHVIEDMDGRIDMILDGGDVDIGVESTILDLTEEVPVILRPGAITDKDLAVVLGDVRYDPGIIASDSAVAPKAPGMKYRHYAPKGELVVVTGSRSAVADYINSRAEEGRHDLIKTGVICADEHVLDYRAAVIKCAGRLGDEDTAAHRLYSILREFDAEEVDMIYSEAFDSEGIGNAVMNRLLKAAGHRVVDADETYQGGIST